MTAPSGDPPGDPQPDPIQFDAAEPAAGAAAAAGTKCSQCERAITTTYHMINNHVICSSCRGRLERELTGGSGAGRMGRAFLWGLGGAAAGSAAYYAVAAITGYILGLVAILVGWLVGQGVHKGSGGRGGAAYQALAVVLTYFAIASAYVPLAIGQAREERASLGAELSNQRAQGAVTAADSAAPDAADSASASADGAARVGFFKAVVILIALVATLPVLGNSPIGWLIVVFALYQAWKMNKAPAIAFTGPFKVGTAPA